MTENVFLDASSIKKKDANVNKAYQVKMENIIFEFPQGFTPLRLIEECRALNCLDLENPDNFDFMYDITMQMLAGKPVFVYFKTDDGGKVEVDHFVVTDRYMNLRGVDIIDLYPVIVNWLVEFVAGELAKKFPRSLEDIRSQMNKRNEERMKKEKELEKTEVRTSF